MEEQWKAIPEFKGRYYVSNQGRIYSRLSDKILKTTVADNGYVHVGLHCNGKAYSKLVHRLVAIAFIPNPYNLPQVNHKDENKENNFVDNLEWVTSLENNNYGTRSQRISEAEKGKANSPETREKISQNHADVSGDNNPMYGKQHKQSTRDKIASKAKRPVMCLETGEVYDSLKEVNEKIGIPCSTLSACCKGKLKTARGFHWKYV